MYQLVETWEDLCNVPGLSRGMLPHKPCAAMAGFQRYLIEIGQDHLRPTKVAVIHLAGRVATVELRHLPNGFVLTAGMLHKKLHAYRIQVIVPFDGTDIPASSSAVIYGPTDYRPGTWTDLENISPAAMTNFINGLNEKQPFDGNLGVMVNNQLTDFRYQMLRCGFKPHYVVYNYVE